MILIFIACQEEKHSLLVFTIDKEKGGIGNRCSLDGFIQALLHTYDKSFHVNPCFPT